MENFFKSETQLFVAADKNGQIVNSNDFTWFGPAFKLSDIRVVMENGETTETVSSFDSNINKSRWFSITNCTKISAEGLAHLYCKKHNITPTKRLYLYRDEDENLYQVVDTNNVEYHFHIARVYYDNGTPRDWSGAYISIRKDDNYKFIEITNINDL